MTNEHDRTAPPTGIAVDPVGEPAAVPARARLRMEDVSLARRWGAFGFLLEPRHNQPVKITVQRY